MDDLCSAEACSYFGHHARFPNHGLYGGDPMHLSSISCNSDSSDESDDLSKSPHGNGGLVTPHTIDKQIDSIGTTILHGNGCTFLLPASSDGAALPKDSQSFLEDDLTTSIGFQAPQENNQSSKGHNNITLRVTSPFGTTGEPIESAANVEIEEHTPQSSALQCEEANHQAFMSRLRQYYCSCHDFSDEVANFAVQQAPTNPFIKGAEKSIVKDTVDQHPCAQHHCTTSNMSLTETYATKSDPTKTGQLLCQTNVMQSTSQSKNAAQYLLQARQSFHSRRGILWTLAQRVLREYDLHPTHLTEDEYISLVLCDEQQDWVSAHLVTSSLIHQRRQFKSQSASTKLLGHDTHPSELGLFLGTFEIMMPKQQDYWLKLFLMCRAYAKLCLEDLCLTEAEFDDFLRLSMSEQLAYIDKLQSLKETELAVRFQQPHGSDVIHSPFHHSKGDFSVQTETEDCLKQGLDTFLGSFSNDSIPSLRLGSPLSSINYAKPGMVHANATSEVVELSSETRQSSLTQTSDNLTHQVTRAHPNSIGRFSTIRRVKKLLHEVGEYDDQQLTVTPARHKLRKSISKLFDTIRGSRDRSEVEHIKIAQPGTVVLDLAD